MSRRFTMWAIPGLLLCGSLTASRAARAQEQPEGAKLVLRLPKDKTVRFRHVARTDQNSDLGLIPAVTTMTIARDVTLTSLGSGDDGATRVTWRFDRVWGRGETPLGATAFDSADSAAEFDLLTSSLSALGGTSFTVTFGPRGDVRKVEGLDAARKAAVSRVKEDAEMYGMILALLLTEEKVRAEIEYTLLLTALPDAPPAVGAAWTDTDRIPGTAGLAFEMRSERRIDGVEGDALNVASDTRGGAVAEGRGGSVAAAVIAAPPEAFRVKTTGTLSAADGLPTAHETLFAVSHATEDEDGATHSFEQRMHVALTRLTGDAREKDDPVGTFPVFPASDPDADVAEMDWMHARAELHSKSDSPDEAAAELTKALRFGAAVLKRNPADAKRLEAWVRLAKSFGFHERDTENFDASRAVWNDIRSRCAALRKADKGTPWLTWEEAHAGVMSAMDTALLGDFPKAAETFAETQTLLAASIKAAPDDLALVDLQAFLLERWSADLGDAGDHKAALARGEEALAVRDGLAAQEPRTPRQQKSLVDGLWDLADVALAAGDAKKAATLLDRAHRDVEPLTKVHESFAAYRGDIAARRDAVLAIASGAKPSGPRQAVDMAYLLTTMRRHADAAAHFEIAFADAAIRDDWENSNLYNAACAAALAHAAAGADDKPRLAKLALGWLAPHVAHLKARLAAATDDEDRAGATKYLDWCREGDKDMASLRPLPEFKAIFSE